MDRNANGGIWIHFEFKEKVENMVKRFDRYNSFASVDVWTIAYYIQQLQCCMSRREVFN